MSANFYNWLQQRIAEYEVARDRGIQAHMTRWKNAFADQNNGASPVEGKYGTLHAPFDGYLHTWTEGDQEFQDTYLAGQFLPMSKMDVSLSQGAFNGDHSFKAPVDRADKFIAEWDELPEQTRSVIHVSRSRSFDFKGKTYCYLRITKCPEDISSAIENKVMGDLYELQKIAEEKSEAERAERDAAHESGADVEEGRVVITGEVLAFKWQTSEYGDTLKMLVQDDRGFRVWGSVPKSLDDAERNSRISFTATVQKSNRDSKFGFFKRPSKAEILEVAA